MQERELELDGGLRCVIEKEKACITGYHGAAGELVIPDVLEGCPVTEIGKKAFLSRKGLRKITLPDSLETVGDWAFACCTNLREAVFPEKDIRFGRNVFLECGCLTRISKRGAEENERFQPELLAAAVRNMEAYYLLELPAVGSGEWLAKWDARLAALLGAPDQEGYSRQVLCGEEDYGSTDLAAYISERRKGKVRLSLLRLLHPRGLAAPFRKELEDHLRSYTRGGEGDETWQVILREHGEERAYYGLFAELGCVTGENLDGILADIREDFPEMKAFFLRYQEENLGGRDFFDSLELS